MQLFEIEIEDARRQLATAGRDVAAYEFKVVHLPPDPDAAGMFTARYEISASHAATGKACEYIGGIGLDWLDDFRDDLANGCFD
jgi:hypothetical protein